MRNLNTFLADNQAKIDRAYLLMDELEMSFERREIRAAFINRNSNRLVKLVRFYEMQKLFAFVPQMSDRGCFKG